MRIAMSLAVVFGLSAAVAAAQQPQPAPQAPAAPQAPQPAPKPELKVVTIDAAHAIVLPMKGSYMQHEDAFSRLMSEAGKLSAAPTGPMFARYLSDPSSTPEAELVWEVGLPVPASVVKVEAPLEIRDIPASLTAVRTHTGPMEDLGAAWPAFVGQIMSSGYTIAGPATQVFNGTPGADMSVEMRLPVSR
jgi:effector-binding domain-containing protein